MPISTQLRLLTRPRFLQEAKQQLLPTALLSPGDTGRQQEASQRWLLLHRDFGLDMEGKEGVLEKNAVTAILSHAAKLPGFLGMPAAIPSLPMREAWRIQVSSNVSTNPGPTSCWLCGL